MKKLFVIFLLLFLSSTVWAAEEFSFRGVKFGMTQEQVLSIETAEMLREPHWSLLDYRLEDLYGLETYCKYYFSNLNKLKRIVIVLSIPITVDFKSKYNEILLDLLEKYNTNFDKPICSMKQRELTKLAPYYFIINEEAFAPGLLVSLTSLEGQDDKNIIFIYFNRMDNVEVKDFLEEYKNKLKPVKQKESNKIIGK